MTTKEWVQDISRQQLRGESIREPAGPVDNLSGLCLQVFQHVWDVDGDEMALHPSLSPIRMKDEYIRLKLWRSELDMGSIDNALNLTSSLGGLVMERLRDIARLILRAIETPYRSKILRMSMDELKAAMNMQGKGYAQHDEDDSEESDAWENETTFAAADIAQLHCQLAFHTIQLFEATPLVQRSIDRLERSRIKQPPYESSNVSEPAQVYVNLVKDRFRNVSDQLARRLGQANWQRHQELRIGIQEQAAVIDKAIRHIFKDSGYDSRQIEISPYEASTKSHASHSSLKSIGSEEDIGRPQLPSAPSGVLQGNEPCPYCHEVLKVSNRIEWGMHVFSDLRAYLCTHDDCRDCLTRYKNREEWAQHEFSTHRLRKIWQCPECDETFTKVFAWQQHQLNNHDIRADSQKDQYYAEDSRKDPILAIESEQCYLCKNYKATNKRDFITHVGRHLEDVALLVIPRAQYDDEADDTDSEDLASLAAKADSSHTASNTDAEDRIIPQGVDVSDNVLKYALQPVSAFQQLSRDANSNLGCLARERVGQHSRGGAPTSDAGRPFNERQDHYPLFCLAPAPEEYFAAINSTRDPGSGWLAITTSSHLPFLDLLKELQSNFDLPPEEAEPTPFLNNSIPQIHDYYNTHVRRGLDSSGPHPFTKFVFLAVDRECYSRPLPNGGPSSNTRSHAHAPTPPSGAPLDPSDFTILVCTDAPDFYQLDSTTSPTLQTLRLPLDAALGPDGSLAQAIDTLTMTPSEAMASHEVELRGAEEGGDPEADIVTLRQMPPALFWPLEPYSMDMEEQEYSVATIEQSRILRRRGLETGEAVGWVVGKGPPERNDEGEDESSQGKEKKKA